MPAFRLKPIVLALALLTTVASAARAAENETIVLRFENHHFTPTQLSVAAGKPLVIEVENASAETIEFESFKLNREKSIAPGHKVTIRLPALQPASYEFYDDFHQDVPEGTIIAK